VTSEDVRSELDKRPFIPLRLHLVSGKTLEIRSSDDTAMLQNALMLFQPIKEKGADPGYDVIALRNIERIEQLRGKMK
jgi:hypothetical protein